MNFLLGLRGPRAFLGPPLPVEAQVPAFILGRHQRRVVVLQELLHEHTFLVPAVALREEVKSDLGASLINTCVREVLTVTS